MDTLILFCKVVGALFNSLLIIAWFLAMVVILIDLYFTIRYR